MEAVRENVSRRLSTGIEGQTSTQRQSVSVDATNRSLILSESATKLGATDLSKDKRSQIKVPITINYEQERYNPDGSLRTVHQLPDQQKSWEEAKKARYIRSRVKREHETELTIDEIFNKPSE
ncbi:hypothetical protein CHS0354_038878 [Potamilus streckersoni]|uniref:Uncharacterized protein n=1 Tax=Potamilus streckersoni TaxID=2493646 RepID=A0AAE0VSQ7_9BIVA|nr:hypothetical protein CHS0354_038878 [Potamilus streckersoni]